MVKPGKGNNTFGMLVFTKKMLGFTAELLLLIMALKKQKQKQRK